MPATLVHDGPPDDGLQLPEWKRGLLRRLAALQADTARLFDAALESGNIIGALQAVARAEKQIWLEWQICEEPRAAPSVNVAVLNQIDDSPRERLMSKIDAIIARRALAASADHPEQ